MPKNPSTAATTNAFPIIAIGASAGGLSALKELIPQINGHNAAVFVVLHLSRKSIGEFLVTVLQRVTNYNVLLAEDGMPVRPNTIYIPLPDTHLIVKDDKINIGRGPMENRWRPSIDVMMRSLAVHYTSRVCGIILTGLLNDGSAGMQAIQRTGGTTMVQDPNEAEYPQMPMSVADTIAVDQCISLSEFGSALDEFMTKDFVPLEVPEDIAAEAAISESVSMRIEEVSSLGVHSVFSCPDCGGGLWEIVNGKITKYRCHVGHAYSEEDLEIKQSESIEATLWVALRMMEERRNLLNKIATKNLERGFKIVSRLNTDNATEIEGHIQRLREVLFATQENKMA